MSTPTVADQTLISIVTLIYANNSNLVFFLLHLSLRTAGLELDFPAYPSRAVSSALLSLSHCFSDFEFWSLKLVGGGGCCTASGSPSGVPALYNFCCSRGSII